MIITYVFEVVLKICITGMVTAFVLLFIKLIFNKRMSASWHYYIWLILIIRLFLLVFPQSHISIFNLIPYSFEQQHEAVLDTIPLNEGFPKESQSTVSNASEISAKESAGSAPHVEYAGNIEAKEFIPASASKTESHSLPDILSIIWFSGMLLFLAYTIGLNIHIRRTIQKCEKCRDIQLLNILEKCKKSLRIKSHIRVCVCDRFGSPGVYGLIKPELLVPVRVINELSQTGKRYVLMHELMHLKRMDMIINSILIFLKAFYWFNPVFWLCFALMRKDCETSCDEMVLGKLDPNERIRYGKTIVDMSSYYSSKKIQYPVMGMINRKSDTEKRVKKVLGFKKQPVIWVAAAVIVAVTSCAVLLTNGVNNHKPEDNPVYEENTGALELEQSFVKIYKAVEDGYSKEHIKENLKKEYDDIVSKGSHAFEFLKAQINGNDADERTKFAAEWLISDIIKLNSGSDYAHYRQIYGVSAVKQDCSGMTGPGEEFDEWCRIEKNTLIYITGFLNIDWYTARRVVPLPETAVTDSSYVSSFMETDQVEFWINRNDFYFIHKDQPLQFNSVNEPDAIEYTYIVKDSIGKQYCPLLDTYTECIKLHETPDDRSAVVGYAYKNDLVRLKKDQLYKGIIRENGWALIEKIPFYDDSAHTGWIREEYITEITEDSQPNQGFILRNTKLYSQPRAGSEILNDKYPDIGDILLHRAIACVHITGKSDGWYKISTGLNSLTGWVREEDVCFSVGERELNLIYNPEPDFDIFIKQLKYEIMNNRSFILKAEDTGETAQPDARQKEQLANAITEITGFMLHENVQPQREAAYPFYRLDFGTYSIVVTTDNQLLVLMDDNVAYDYGIGRKGMAVRFVTPNAGFIHAIQSLLPAKPNTDMEHLNYLMNAEKLIFSGDYSNKEEFTGQVQINKCVRAIKEAAGPEIPKDGIEHGFQQKNIYIFYINGERFDVTHTDKYIEYRGKYYESLVQPGHLAGGLFAAYF